MNLMLALASCGQSMTEGGFGSAVPAARIDAAEKAARENNRSAIPQLVELLASDDAAVRFAAIGALQRMTGETYGYRAQDTAANRRKSIDEWVRMVESGNVPQAATAVSVNEQGGRSVTGGTRG